MHIAIIAEYNPFHKGHEYQLNEARRLFGKDAVISVILGGIFSQRGEPYVTTPYIRAEAALACGADLAVEMPFPFSCAPASVFARAGVEIANGIGADVLLFGSECGDVEKLWEILEKLDSEQMQAALSEKSEEIDTLGKTRVYSEAFASLYGDGDRLDMPNDILAIEYMRAIKRTESRLRPHAILRKGDYKSGEGEFASASSIRRDYGCRGIDALKSTVPDAAFEIFKKADDEGLLFPSVERLFSAAVMKLSEPLSEDIAFSASGIVGRLKGASRDAKSVSDLLQKAATKRYTDAELSRALLYTLTTVKREDVDAPVRYTKLLAANSRGREIIGRDLSIELLTKPSDSHKLSRAALIQYEKTFLAERAYSLCLGTSYEFLKQVPKIGK